LVQIVIPLTQMNHPALQLNGLKVGEYLLEVSEVQPGSYDTVRVLLKSDGVPKFQFDVWAPRDDFAKPEFLERVRNVISHGANGGLTCGSCILASWIISIFWKRA
jgi:hypothetical protein